MRERGRERNRHGERNRKHERLTDSQMDMGGESQTWRGDR